MQLKTEILEEGFVEPPEGDVKGLYRFLKGKMPLKKDMLARRLKIEEHGICRRCCDDVMPIQDFGLCYDCYDDVKS